MGVTVGACRISLRLPENHSLKGKRQVIKSLISRLHNKFNVSAAEVDNNDAWQIATIAVVSVANSERHAAETVQSVVDFVRRERLDAEILDVQNRDDSWGCRIEGIDCLNKFINCDPLKSPIRVA